MSFLFMLKKGGATQRRQRKAAPPKGGGRRQHHQKEEGIAAIGRRHHRSKGGGVGEVSLSLWVMLLPFSSLQWGCFFPRCSFPLPPYGWSGLASPSFGRAASSSSFGWCCFPNQKKTPAQRTQGRKHPYPKEGKECGTTQQKAPLKGVEGTPNTQSNPTHSVLFYC